VTRHHQVRAQRQDLSGGGIIDERAEGTAIVLRGELRDFDGNGHALVHRLAGAIRQ